jgi:hypothetical protein
MLCEVNRVAIELLASLDQLRKRVDENFVLQSKLPQLTDAVRVPRETSVVGGVIGSGKKLEYALTLMPRAKGIRQSSREIIYDVSDSWS